MPELRRDPIAGRWVIISPERAMRPGQLKPTARYAKPAAETCPFCEGRESMTPPEIWARRREGPPNGPGWKLRVVPNKYPALRIEGSLDKRGDGIYDAMNGIGAHEVIVESPQHLWSTSDQTPSQVAETLAAYKARMTDLARDPRFVYCLIFKNVGDAAGASLEHTHSQLIATPIIPMRVQSKLDRSKQYFDFRGRCIFCDMIQQEMTDDVRVVTATDHFVSLQPFAPRFPFETWIFPRGHVSHFENTPDERLPELAALLHETIVRIERVALAPAYNYLIHTAPNTSSPSEHFHWHLELLPRLTRVAGFEWGTGFYINPLPPEDAARYLREAGTQAGRSRL